MRDVVPGTELQGRLERLRSALPGVRVVHGRSNIRYLTGYDGGGFTPWLIVSDDELEIVHYTADEESLGEIPHLGAQRRPFSQDDVPLEVLTQTLHQHRGSEFSADLQWWNADEADIEGVKLSDCSKSMAALRAVKSLWEIEQLRKAGEITMASMDAIEKASAAGASSRDLAIELYRTSISLGADPSTAIPYISVGEATLENHTSWDWGDSTEGGNRYLFEFATSVNGYHTPLSRSSVPDDEGRAALDAVRLGLVDVLNMIGPGIRASEVHRTMVAALEQGGFTFKHRSGYSIGLGELGTWMEGEVARIGPLEDYSLVPGMCFHVVGSVVEAGGFGVAESRSLVVTDHGYELLAR